MQWFGVMTSNDTPASPGWEIADQVTGQLQDAVGSFFGCVPEEKAGMREVKPDMLAGMREVEPDVLIPSEGSAAQPRRENGFDTAIRENLQVETRAGEARHVEAAMAGGLEEVGKEGKELSRDYSVDHHPSEAETTPDVGAVLSSEFNSEHAEPEWPKPPMSSCAELGIDSRDTASGQPTSRMIQRSSGALNVKCQISTVHKFEFTSSPQLCSPLLNGQAEHFSHEKGAH